MLNETMRLLIRAAATVLALLILSMTGCVMHTDYRISQDVRNGAKPLEASCAHSLGGSNECLVMSGR